MLKSLIFIAFLFIGFDPLSAKPPFKREMNVQSAIAQNQALQFQFAEDVVMIELARGLSKIERFEKEKLLPRFQNDGMATEIAIGLLGANRVALASQSLVNLLALRLDAAASEERSCQILLHTELISRKLKKLDPKKLTERCKLNFSRLEKRELSDIQDVSVERVCHKEDEVLSLMNEMSKALKSKAVCR